YLVGKLFRVHINGVPITSCDVVRAFAECKMGIVPRPETIAAVSGLGLVERHECLGSLLQFFLITLGEPFWPPTHDLDTLLLANTSAAEPVRDSHPRV